MALGRTAKYYHSHPESYRKKKEKDTEYMTSTKGLKYRKMLKRIRNKAKSEGKDIEGKHFDHHTSKFTSPKANMGRKEKSRLKGSKRK